MDVRCGSWMYPSSSAMAGRTRVARPVVGALALCAALAGSAASAATVLSFESLTDLESVTTQFTGLTFSNTIALQAGASLNEAEFPPRSGSIVVSDDGGAISLSFTVPVTAVGAYLTYAMPVTLTAFDALDNMLGNVTSAFGINTALSGDPGSAPNEFLELSFDSGISRLTITGDALGASFVLDDLTLTPAIPEPHSAVLVLIGLAGLLTRRRAALA